MKPAAGAAAAARQVHRCGVPRRRDNLLVSLLGSLLLHALVISLQFGEIGGGLPWLGGSGEPRVANVPTLNAVLRSEVVAQKPIADQTPEARVSRNNTRAAKPLLREPPPPRLPREAATASSARLVTIPKEAGKPGRVAGVPAEVPKIEAPDSGSAILSTDQESTWRQPVAQARQEEEASQAPAAVEKTGEAAAPIQQKMVEDLARIEEEKAKLAAAERQKELVLERKRAEELAHAEQKKAEQAALVAAQEEALAKQAEADALARQRQAEQLAAAQAAAAKVAAEKAAAERAAAEKAAAERSLAAERSRLAAATAGQNEAGRQSGIAPSAAKGSDLAGRALDMARSGLPGLPARPVAEPDKARRGSILGRDPRDIQLAFYGEGWRLKVERIGSMNFPRLSKNLSYDPLVVTVSINSDGTLAGVRIEKSSGHRELDEAVRRIVEMSAPFAAFPPDLKRSYDVVDITRTWSFQEDRPRITGQ